MRKIGAAVLPLVAILLVVAAQARAQTWRAGTPQALPTPFRQGTGAPTWNCVTGQRYFQEDATAGANWWDCTSTNVWTLQTGGGGALGERYSWGLCLGVDCAVAADLSNAVLVARNVTISACYGKAKTAPTGADLNIIIKRNGANNIFTTDLTIPAGSVAVQTELGISAAGVLTAGQYLTIDITQVGAVVAGQTVSVVCVGN